GLYATHLVLPLRLSIHYPPAGPGSLPVAGALILLALLAACVLLFRGRAPLPGLAAAWLLASLLPFNDVFPRTSVTAADRYLAVGLPAFALAAALALERLPRSSGVLVLAGLLAWLGWLTQARTREFEDGETVFRSAMRADPDDPLPPEQVAEALLASGGGRME